MRLVAVTVFLLALVLLWDATGLDLALARVAGGATGFVLRENRAFILVMHEIPRFASTAGVIVLFLLAVWPLGFMRRLTRGDRFQLAGTVLAAAVVLGFVLGLGQQWRGAHYMSHTLWTGWICWTVALVIEFARHRPRFSFRPS